MHSDLHPYLFKLSNHEYLQAGESLPILSGIQIRIDCGKTIGFLGPSGCGKSTLMRLLANREQPQNGTVERKFGWLNAEEQPIAYMAQDDQLLPFRTTLQNILLPMEVDKRLTKTNRDEAHLLIERSGLSGFENYLPHQLSGGMQRRCLMVMHLMTKRLLYIFDEPFAALDMSTVDQMAVVLHEFKEKTKASLVLVLHDVQAAASVCDEICVLSKRPAHVIAHHRPSSEMLQLPPARRRQHADFDALVLRIIHSLGATHSSAATQ